MVKKKVHAVEKLWWQKSAGDSLVPWTTRNNNKVFDEERLKRLGKKEYYRRKAVVNREFRGEPEKKLSKEEKRIVMKHRVDIKRRIERKREELELKKLEEW